MKNTKKKGKEDDLKRRLAPYSKMDGDQLLEVFCSDSELRKEFGSDCIETTLCAFLDFITSIRQNYENSPIQQDDVWRSLVDISHESIVQEFKRLRMAGKSPAKCKENWEAIRSEYDISKKDFGKKINFVKDSFKRSIIFRDVEHAFVLASQGFSKPALILAGGVIEELLRQYLKHKNIKPKDKKFFAYIKACEDNNLLKRGVSRLTDSIRDFRNLVHLENEETKRHTVSKATAKGAVSSIFTIANDFQ